LLKKTLYLLVLLSLVASIAAPTFAVSDTVIERLETSIVGDPVPDEPIVDSPSPVLLATVNIRNINNKEYVYSNLLIIASVTGFFSKVYYQIDSGAKYPMTKVGTTNRFQAVWNTLTATAAPHTLWVKAVNLLGMTVGSAYVYVTVVRSFRYRLYYEIDYMSGHYPPASVLNYMKAYWQGHATQVTFRVDDLVTDPTPADGKITTSDFWKIEKAKNDVWMYDDRSFGGVSKKFTLKEKWMLYGTYADSPTTGGYCYIVRSGSDVLAGNYIFIADSMLDKWEYANGVPYDGAEEVVVMHEAGHSIGIAKLSATYTEVYDSDYYSVMALIRVQNAKYMALRWYYSKEYWATANRAYYI